MLSTWSWHSAAEGLEVDQHFTSKDLGPLMEYVEDPDHSYDLDQIKGAQWQKVGSRGFNKGFSDSQYWFRIKIANKGNTLKNYVLENRHPFLDTMDIIYERNGTTLWKDILGDQLPVNKRRLKHSDFLSSFSLNANETVDIYVRIASESTVQLPLTLWEEDHYKEHNHKNSLLIGLLLGFLIAIAAYHVSIYFSISEPVYVYYGLFIIGTIVSFACFNGIPGLVFWPNANAAADNVLLVGLLVSATFNCLFARNVVDTPERTPRINIMLNVCIATSIVGFVLLPILPYAMILKLSCFALALSVFLVVPAFIIASLQKYQPAYYALIGSVMAGVGICISMFDKLGLLPSNSFNSYAVYIGLTLMTLVQAFALSYRIKVANDMQEKAQQELITTQQALNTELDTMVRQRTEELEAANERLVELSTVDGLTGLRNRRYFDEGLEREYRNAFRNKLSIGILIMDIDHFKSVNDTYGHPFGDLCLKEMSEIARTSVRRPHDIVARYGGEEFVVLLPNTDLAGTLHIASVIRDRVKAHSFEDESHSIQLTISIGAFSEIPVSPEAFAMMVESADQLLYRAKKNGRDRICSNSDQKA